MHSPEVLRPEHEFRPELEPTSDCFIEKILAANAEEAAPGDGLVGKLESEIAQAPTVNNITKLVTCDRCSEDFKVYNDGVVFLPKDPSRCSEEVQSLQATTNSVQIDLSKFVDPILW